MATQRRPYDELPDLKDRLNKLLKPEAAPELLGAPAAEAMVMPDVAGVETARGVASTSAGLPGAAKVSSGPSDMLSAGIGAAAGLATGLFSAAAAKKRQQDDMMFDATNQRFQSQSKAVQNLGSGQREAMNRLVQNLRGSL